MSYSVDWIKKNMGISRKTLLVYEKREFIKPERNEGNGYREYSDEDLRCIWIIKLLVELNYSLDEIDSMRNPKYDFRKSIIQKIEQLEKEKNKIEQLIGHAKYIKATGRMPVLPKNMGSIKFEDFLQSSYEEWNTHTDQYTKLYQKVIEQLADNEDIILNKDEEIQLMEMWGEIDFEWLVGVQDKINELIKYSDLRSFDPIVQKEVKELYEYYCKYISDDISSDFTPLKFADHVASTFISGDVAVINRNYYGSEVCEFIANAIIFFGENN